ncbi:MAG: DUF1800 domain-containing protein [Hasllibacter sp.]
MSFDPETAAIRFGVGLSPVVPPPASAAAMLDLLAGPDAVAARLPVERLTEHVRPRQAAFRQAARATREARRTGDAEAEAAGRDAQRRLRQAENMRRARRLAAILGRMAVTPDGLRERLVHFWADHFTVEGRGNLWRLAVAAHVEEAIRPHVAGRFGDLLVSAVTSPMMLVYLDGASSIGPGSAVARRIGGGRGLNENLAREVLELHTLGAGGPYAQADVTELAALLTGLAVGDRGTGFIPARAEPGPERVLGRDWGGDPPRRAHVEDFLQALARRPETARHVCGAMAAHFLGPAPPPAVAAAMAAAWTATGGDLLEVVGAMLARPEAWDGPDAGVKPPLAWMGSGLRALAVPPERLAAEPPARIHGAFLRPLAAMGQPYEDPPGPDGWPEAPEAWVTPPGQAARIGWAMRVPARLGDLPDPRALARHALGRRAGGALRFAVGAAEDRVSGVALVLASPEFQRR